MKSAVPSPDTAREPTRDEGALRDPEAAPKTFRAGHLPATATGAVPAHGSGKSRLDSVLRQVREVPVTETCGRVAQVIGLVIESEGPVAGVGEVCRIESARHDGTTLAEVVGFRNHHLLLMPLGELRGIHPGSEVIATGAPLRMPVGAALKGRVLDGLGRPIDSLGPVIAEQEVELNHLPPHPLRRQRISHVFQTGIKAIDTFIPCGRGQRLGIFSGSGVGKSTLLGMMASRAEADVNVIALIGERGREVREFLERDLDEVGRRKSVVIVATSNEPALHRVKGAYLAMAIAEYFRNTGQNVLLMMDSVTRLAMAQREIGLAVGEPPTTRGYTPSVFSLLPQLLERAGSGETGATTGLFTVLVEADDMNDPIADAVRSILDGHIVLTRELATSNHYPAIDVLESVSRLNRDLLSPEQLELAAAGREHLAAYRRNQDLINIGAYPAGSNPDIDRAILLHEPLNRFLRQGIREGFSTAHSWSLLRETLATPSRPAAAQTHPPK
jgi:flagellum-specific ATP synthase